MPLAPYQARVYETNAPSRLADLARNTGAVQANAIMRGAEIKSRMIGELGQQASGMLSDLAKMKMDEPRRKHDEAKMAHEQQAMQAQEELAARKLEASRLEPQEAIKHLRASGQGDAADELEQRWTRKRLDAINLNEAEVKALNTKLKRAGTIFKSIDEQPDLLEARGLYKEHLPELRALGGEAAKTLPEEFDPGVVKRAREWGMSQEEIAAAELSASRLARSKIEDKREDETYFAKVTNARLRSVKSQDQFDEGRQRLEAIGVPKAFLDTTVGTTFSPETMQRVTELDPTYREKEYEPGSVGDMVKRYATANHLDVDEVPTKVVESIRARHLAQGRVGEKAPGVGSFEDYVQRYANENNVSVGKISTKTMDELRAKYSGKGAGGVTASDQKWYYTRAAEIDKNEEPGSPEHTAAMADLDATMAKIAGKSGQGSLAGLKADAPPPSGGGAPPPPMPTVTWPSSPFGAGTAAASTGTRAIPAPLRVGQERMVNGVLSRITRIYSGGTEFDAVPIKK